MITPYCHKCRKELTNFGAIILSPPNRADEVKKYHICKKCYKDLFNWIWNIKKYKKEE